MILKLALVFMLIGQAPPGEEPVKAETPATQEVQGAEKARGEKAAQPEAQETEQPQGSGQQQPAPVGGCFGAGQGEEGEGRPAWITWVILIGILVVFYLLMILPQRRRRKKHQEMLKSLNRGDRVVTSGGILGTITRVKEETFVIKTADKTELEIDKSVVSQKK